jgi:hypothetical protein
MLSTLLQIYCILEFRLSCLHTLNPILCEVSVELVSFIKNGLSFKELLRLEVFVGVKIWIAMFWVTSPRIQVGCYQSFGKSSIFSVDIQGSKLCIVLLPNEGCVCERLVY